MLSRIEQAMEAGLVRPIDFVFARFLQRCSQASAEVVLAACLASHRVGQGHVCADLRELAGTHPFGPGDGSAPAIEAPGYEHWCSALRSSEAVGEPGDSAPLILDPCGRLYLCRYWYYESGLAAAIRSRIRRPVKTSETWLRDALDRYFPSSAGRTGADWQRLAAAVAVLKPFSVISGGPGTGKTTTVTRILALLLEQAGGKPLRISLAAPTGKAAARLTESIRATKQDQAHPLRADPAVLARIPEQAQTLHRLLGTRPGRAKPKHHAGNPLAVDVLVLDEASMVDLPLMAKLLAALPDRARLILLGDRDQLSSVEAGKVLGDLCDAGTTHAYSPAFQAKLETLTRGLEGLATGGPSHPVGDCVVMLKESHRFAGGIGRLASAVNTGRCDAALSILRSSADADVQWRDLSAHALRSDLMAVAMEGYRGYLDEVQRGNAREALDCFERYRLLCALRQGRTGVEAINMLIEKMLRRAGFIDTRERWYRGRPVMVTRNDYALRLFNGDIGLIMPDPEVGGYLRAFFRKTDLEMGHDSVDGGLRKVLPNRLPEHETVFATTVHKSQGSEFENLELLLSDQLSPVLTRELVYTGVTRARSGLRIWSREDVFRDALAKTVVRSSGLRQALWA